MNERVKRLAEEASRLSPAERVDLVADILQSLDAADPRLDGLWAAEAEDRLAAYKRGEIASDDFDAVVKPPSAKRP